MLKNISPCVSSLITYLQKNLVLHILHRKQFLGGVFILSDSANAVQPISENDIYYFYTVLALGGLKIISSIEDMYIVYGIHWTHPVLH